MLRVTLITLLAFAATAARFESLDAEEKPSGVAKVVKILTDMRAQLQKEADTDDEVMEKMACWCETNDKAKTKAIADNTQKSSSLSAAIEEYTAAEATLQSEIEQLAKDLAENNKELEEATNIRNKEAGEFAEDEKEQLSSINGLTGAVKTLGSKLALKQESLLQVKQVLESNKVGLDLLRKLHITPAQRREVQSFLQASSNSKTPGSNEILGVLKQMKENFETNYKEAQDTENEAKKAYSQLKASKDKEIASCNEQTDAKSAQLADTVERLSQSKVDLADTSATLEADTKFLADLKERCENMDEEFAARAKMRSEEITAVSEALGILTSDDAKDQFKKSINFVQVRKQQSSNSAIKRAARVVSAAAQKYGNPKLSALAMMIQSTGVFTKIKQAIDGMLAQLKQENKDEIKHKDWCVEELHQNEMQTDDAYDKKKELSTQEEDLALFIDKLQQEIDADNSEINDMKVALKQAAENRQAENADFQMTVNDQRATQKLLEAALEKLRNFYKNKAALLQTNNKQATGQAPPPGFGGEYKKSGGSAGVMMMIEGVIKESKTVEEEAVAAEQDATTGYEQFVAESNDGIASLNKGLAEKKASQAKANQDRARTGADIKANFADITNLNEMAQELHLSCDFTLKNFEVRQGARAAEMEALNQAKAVLSGATLS